MWVLPYANHQFTVMPSGLWVPSSAPRSKAVEGQLTDRGCYERNAGSRGSPLRLLGAAVKLRPWALAWTVLQLCHHHIDAWACTLLIQTLTQTFRCNIPAWSQGCLITMGLLSGLDSQLNLAKVTRSALLALFRCSGLGPCQWGNCLCQPCYQPQLLAHFLLGSRLPLLFPGRSFLSHFSFRLLLLLK